ncbi:hypothetical protein BU26DRAFT_570250 [Trematosphaeria pertusa]|uniref:Uncharacterized protein n=1 Tax=Trematosphaeria pertusa TaxID=390896 RepID=A0A6A6I1V5_9PLEO|nr:uncharacterized protein BU26DRAFT_570250 [Trematosphaeria pertusa]KAF2243560.1 hypothetical protein BU26DRAFT_570250 [Trematosphaeria pertusa]
MPDCVDPVSESSSSTTPFSLGSSPSTAPFSLGSSPRTPSPHPCPSPPLRRFLDLDGRTVIVALLPEVQKHNRELAERRAKEWAENHPVHIILDFRSPTFSEEQPGLHGGAGTDAHECTQGETDKPATVQQGYTSSAIFIPQHYSPPSPKSSRFGNFICQSFTDDELSASLSTKEPDDTASAPRGRPSEVVDNERSDGFERLDSFDISDNSDISSNFDTPNNSDISNNDECPCYERSRVFGRDLDDIWA